MKNYSYKKSSARLSLRRSLLVAVAVMPLMLISTPGIAGGCIKGDHIKTSSPTSATINAIIDAEVAVKQLEVNLDELALSAGGGINAGISIPLVLQKSGAIAGTAGGGLHIDNSGSGTTNGIIAVNGGLGSTKISENESPRPQDRAGVTTTIGAGNSSFRSIPAVTPSSGSVSVTAYGAVIGDLKVTPHTGGGVATGTTNGIIAVNSGLGSTADGISRDGTGTTQFKAIVIPATGEGDTGTIDGIHAANNGSGTLTKVAHEKTFLDGLARAKADLQLSKDAFADKKFDDALKLAKSAQAKAHAATIELESWPWGETQHGGIRFSDPNAPTDFGARQPRLIVRKAGKAEYQHFSSTKKIGDGIPGTGAAPDKTPASTDQDAGRSDHQDVDIPAPDTMINMPDVGGNAGG